MREHILAGIEGLVGIAGYFLLTDFVRPIFEERHMLAFWWVTLGLYVALVIGYGCRTMLSGRPVFAIGEFLLLAATVYLYDPFVQARLVPIGLGWLWIVSLVAFFIWIFVFVKTIRRQDQQKRG